MHVAAPGRRDAPVPAEEAGVTFVMPFPNEERYLRRAVETVLAQDVPVPVELVLALEPSSDGTDDIARALAAADPRILLVDNPAADIPVGLNRAIRAGRYPTVVRVDAHSEIAPDYTRRALATLARVRAANVGGVRSEEHTSELQSLMRNSYAVFCLKKKKHIQTRTTITTKYKE